MECFTADVFQFSSATVKTCFLDIRLGNNSLEKKLKWLAKDTPFLFVKGENVIKMVTENWKFLCQIMTHYINVIVHSCCLILPFLLLPGVYAIYEVSLFHSLLLFIIVYSIVYYFIIPLFHYFIIAYSICNLWSFILHYIVKIPKKFTVQYHFFGYLQQKTDTRVVSLYSFAEILEHLKVILIFHFDAAFAIWICFRVLPNDTPAFLLAF